MRIVVRAGNLSRVDVRAGRLSSWVAGGAGAGGARVVAGMRRRRRRREALWLERPGWKARLPSAKSRLVGHYQITI